LPQERQFKFGICNLQVDGKEETNRFLQAAKHPLPQHPLTQNGAGSGKFRRELRARLCCALFNAIPNTHALPESCRPKTRASLIACIHEPTPEQAHRRCKSAKFLRCLPRPTSSRAIYNLEFAICKLVRIPKDKTLRQAHDC